MKNWYLMGIFGIALFLSGCVSDSVKKEEKNDQVDVYLSTLDDKHFVWCNLDLEQCRKNFENWKISPKGRFIIREYEKEKTGQTYNMHNVPNVFRAHFVDESEIIEQDENLLLKDMEESAKIFGPEVPSNY